MIFIILPVHNRIALTEKFIDCLVKQTYQNYHLILVDDGSTDGTKEMVASSIENHTIVNGDGELWWAGSLQAGIDCLKTKIHQDNPLVLLINDDLAFKEDYLQNAVEFMESADKTLLLSQFLNKDNQIEETGLNMNLNTLRLNVVIDKSQINCLSTRGLFLYWKDILDIGEFLPNLLPHYLSDYEFTTRAYKKGYKCMTTSKVYIDPKLEMRQSIKHKKTAEKIKFLFSKKNEMNPYCWSVFIWLVCDFPQKIFLMPKMWLVCIYLSFKNDT